MSVLASHSSSSSPCSRGCSLRRSCIHSSTTGAFSGGNCAISVPAASATARSSGDAQQPRFGCRGAKVARSSGYAFRVRERDTTVLLPKVPRSPTTAICQKQPAPVGLAACPNLLAYYRHSGAAEPFLRGTRDVRLVEFRGHLGHCR
jgi:hypothetical protein